MKRVSIFILSLAFAGACTAEKPVQAPPVTGEKITVRITAQVPETKTTLSDNGSRSSFAFEIGDNVGFYAENTINNEPLTCENRESGSFSGQFYVSGEKAEHRDAVNYYAYYPYTESGGDDPSCLTGTLPSIQCAPFDGNADFIIATPLVDVFDVDPFPSLAFTFENHLFSIVKLSITNSSTDEGLAGEEVLSIGLRSPGGVLSGEFTFSAEDPTADAVFTTDVDLTSNKVLVEFPNGSRPVLGCGETHSVYAVVPSGTYPAGGLELIVNTTNYTFTVPTSNDVSLSRDVVTVLPAVDLSSGIVIQTQRVKTMVMWGASSVSNALMEQVQSLVGSNWDVIRSGVAGDSAHQVASRQGGLPMYTQSTAFTLPASSEEYVDIDGIYYYYNGVHGQATHEWTFKKSYTPALNPLIIEGIECEISYDADRAQRRIRRLADGDPVEIPARSEVSTYGSRAYADADLIVVYMGLNGRYYTDDATLIDLHDKLLAHLTNPDAEMIVLGFYPSPYDFPAYWTQEYSDAFTAYYGRYFLDLRTDGGGLNAIPLMKKINQIEDESEISERDWTYINRGDWPFSWFEGENNVHANSFGTKVEAILLRRRMAELGLL